MNYFEQVAQQAIEAKEGFCPRPKPKHPFACQKTSFDGMGPFKPDVKIFKTRGSILHAWELLRENSDGDPTARLFDEQGKLSGLVSYDEKFEAVKNSNLENPQEYFLADYGGIAFLRGHFDQPGDVIKINQPFDLQILKYYPYSKVERILLAFGVKQFLSYLSWCHNIDIIKENGGVPLIGFLSDNEANIRKLKIPPHISILVNTQLTKRRIERCVFNRKIIALK